MIKNLIYIFVVVLVGCRYNDFEPIEPRPVTPWVITEDIADLRSTSVPISGGRIVEGVVIANDSTGNFYRQIIICNLAQTASLAVGVSFYDNYALFAQNQVVAVRLDGLVLRYVDGLLTAGYPGSVSQVSPITTPTLAARHLHLQGYSAQVDFLNFRLSDITSADIGLPRLFENVYFESSNGTLGGEQALCQIGTDTTIALYTSPYATFADSPIPLGVLKIKAIVVGYGGKTQLKITSIGSIEKSEAKKKEKN